MAKKSRKRVKSKKTMRLKLKTATTYSIIQLVFFSVAALIVISFSRQGLLLVRLNDFFVNLFSWTTIFLPFVFLTFGFLVSRFKTPLGQPNVLAGSILTLLSLAAISRAGIVGRYIWSGLAGNISGPGAFFVLLTMLLMGIVVLFNTSLDHLFKHLVSAFRRYGVRGSVVHGGAASAKSKRLKVFESFKSSKANVSPKINEPESIKKPIQLTASPGVMLEEKLVSNIPGQEKVWKYPPLSLLQDESAGKADRGDIKHNAQKIEERLESFGITAKVVEVNLGPAVTQYALDVALGTKLSKITALERDLALALAAPTGTIRIEAPIPGRPLIGIELPNRTPEFVPLKKILEADTMASNKSKLAVALGLDVSGKQVIADIAKMPHILIAGQTGSGKSVCINTFLSTILFRASPSEVKFILVDPKRVELVGYNGIPHLLSPVIVDPKQVVSALRWVMKEMDRRYTQFAQAGVRNIEGYNEMSGFQALPYIIVIIDELADIMLFAPAEVEDSITRIAQMSRATGIHMVLATQRPSVDIITGLIKANIPSRIAFAVSSQVDSRVILDGQGAEKLLGKGDMLYLPPELAKPSRIQGAYVADKDVVSLVSYLKNQGVAPQYTEEVTSTPKAGTTVIPGTDEALDELFKEAVELVIANKKASASLLQRKLSIGYARAARILDQLETAGVVGPGDGSKPREILVNDLGQIFSAPEGQGN